MPRNTQKILNYRRPPKPDLPTNDPARARNWIAWLLIIVTCATFASVATHDFGPIDDPTSISENPKLNPPRSDGLFWFWTHPHMALYIPVTYTAWWLLAKGTWVEIPDENGHMLDARVFHAASLLAHVLSVLAVYGILHRLFRRPWIAAAGALLFALHPLQVEAVAWTSGLKDLMSAMFSLTAIWLYLRAREPSGADVHVASASADAVVRNADATSRPDRQPLSPKSAYLLGMAALVLAMLCKPSAMVTPLIVAIIDYGLLRRPLTKVARSVTPWFLIILPLCIIARLAQPASNIISPPLWQRPIVAGASLAFYLSKLLLPINFSFDYTWRPSLMLQKSWFWCIAIVPVLLAIAFRLRHLRWLAVAGLISIAALLPVLGFVPFLYQTFSTVADHYVYLAMLGPALALAWILSRIPAAQARIASIACSAVYVVLAILTAVQLHHWRDSKSLLDHMIAVQPRTLIGHSSLGEWYKRHHDYASAEKEYKTAIAVDPLFPMARANLVDVYSHVGRIEEAIKEVYVLIDLHAKFPQEVPQEFGDSFFEIGRTTMSRDGYPARYTDAARYFEEDLRLHPANAATKEELKKARALITSTAATRAATTQAVP